MFYGADCLRSMMSWCWRIMADASSTQRRQVRITFMHIFVCLTHWLAPFLVMTAEKAWILAKMGWSGP
jgi:isoleucyl-tRNA synthetase